MLCPKDKNPMKEIYVYRTPVDFCPVCFGIWFDSGELKVLVDKLTFNIKDPNLLKNKINTQDEKEHHWQEDFVDCPRDNIKMFKSDFNSNKKIHLDRCAKCHGVWVDGYELERIEKDVAPNRLMDTIGKATLFSYQDSARFARELKWFYLGFIFNLFSIIFPIKSLFLQILRSISVRLFKNNKNKINIDHVFEK